MTADDPLADPEYETGQEWFDAHKASSELVAQLLPDWENNHCREIVIYTDPDDHPFSCGEHEGFWVGLYSQDGCEQCSGSDETGHDFCPVCEFCCGC